MGLLILIAAVVVMLFGFVVLFGAPYLPTLKKQQVQALDLLNLKAGDTLLELGSGDGRMLRAAAQQGIKAIGYELNPLLVVYSWLSTLKYRKLVTVKCANFWLVKLPPNDGIYVFLLDRFMSKLDRKLVLELKEDTKVVSFAFEIPDRTPIKKKSGLYLYEYKVKKP